MFRAFCERHAPPVLQGQIENISLSALAQQPELRAYRLSPNRGGTRDPGDGSNENQELGCPLSVVDGTL